MGRSGKGCEGGGGVVVRAGSKAVVVEGRVMGARRTVRRAELEGLRI